MDSTSPTNPTGAFNDNGVTWTYQGTLPPLIDSSTNNYILSLELLTRPIKNAPTVQTRNAMIKAQISMAIM